MTSVNVVIKPSVVPDRPVLLSLELSLTAEQASRIAAGLLDVVKDVELVYEKRFHIEH